MRIIEYPSYARTKANRLFRIAAVAFGFVVLGLTLGQIHEPLVFYGFISLPFSGLVFFSTLKRAFNAWQGQSGEDRTARVLRNLSDDYCLIRNMQLGEKHGDIDFVLLGPFGALVLEQKANTVAIRCQGDDWSYKVSPTYWKRMKSYSHQLKRNVKAVQKLIKAPCYGAVVFNDRVTLTVNNPTVDIIRRKELLRYIQALPVRGCKADQLANALEVPSHFLAA